MKIGEEIEYLELTARFGLGFSVGQVSHEGYRYLLRGEEGFQTLFPPISWVVHLGPFFWAVWDDMAV